MGAKIMRFEVKKNEKDIFFWGGQRFRVDKDKREMENGLRKKGETKNK